MAIPARQIGWGTEENLLWEISKQLDYLTKVTYNANNPSVNTFEVPALNETVNAVTNGALTIVEFTGPIANNFTISITTGSNTKLGNKIYLMITGGNPSGTVTFAGDLNNIQCGTAYNTYIPDNDTRNVIEFVYDGVVWTGIDNC